MSQSPPSPRARRAAAQLQRLADLASDLAELIPADNASAHDWFDMLKDSSAWLTNYFSKKRIR